VQLSRHISREYRESLDSTAPVRQCEAARNLLLDAQANAGVALLLAGTVNASTVALAPEERTAIAVSKATAARG
jgi:hypothetical protein